MADPSDPSVPPPDLAAALKASLQAVVSARGAETVDDLRGSITSIKARLEERIAEAVAAEREACAQLADQHQATGSKCPKGIAPNPSSECGCRACRPRFPFADLLRKDDHDRT